MKVVKITVLTLFIIASSHLYCETKLGAVAKSNNHCEMVMSDSSNNVCCCDFNDFSEVEFSVQNGNEQFCYSLYNYKYSFYYEESSIVLDREYILSSFHEPLKSIRLLI